jgi:hypothetical protein
MRMNEGRSDHAARRFSVAKGLLCPSCRRAAQIYDVKWIDQFAFELICGGCHGTLFTCEELRQ